MGFSLESYFEKLELIGFFSAYPLIYALVHVVSGYQTNELIKKRLTAALPYAYALVGLLYLGYQLKNLYPDYSFSNITSSIYYPFLKIWAIISLIFWIPFFSRKPVFSLIHSLLFMYLLCRDILSNAFSSNSDRNIIRNDMKVYTDSLLLNAGAFLVILLLTYFIIRIRKRKSFTN